MTEANAPSQSFDKERDGLHHLSYRNKSIGKKLRANAVSNNHSGERVNDVAAGVRANPSVPTDGETTSQYTALYNVSGHKYQPSPQPI